MALDLPGETGAPTRGVFGLHTIPLRKTGLGESLVFPVDHASGTPAGVQKSAAFVPRVPLRCTRGYHLMSLRDKR